jgi:hypothetical protein
MQAVVFSPDGAALVSAGLDSARVWRLSSKVKAATLATRSPSAGAAWRPDGTMLATPRTVRLWLMPQGRLGHTYPNAQTPSFAHVQ